MKTAMAGFLVACVFCAFSGVADAKMRVRDVQWQLEGRTYQGALVYDDASTSRRPGLLMIPNWYGVTSGALAKAKRIAGRDYVILVGDMYGKGRRPADTAQARSAVRPLYGDRAEMRKRVSKALQVLRAQASSAPIDRKRLAAIGFCFGGSAVLDLARSGADIAAVVSFHGGLSTGDPTLAKNIRAHVLVMNGADDKGTMGEADAFMDEMRGSPADWQFVVLGHAVHCFTETDEHAPGCRYDARAARRSYRLMAHWLDDAFAGADGR
ncbi:dienelactone hydrolase family protein [Oleiagrimonas citrea]|uniref:Dienelactone hydrolase family protein n=2 Tax=Oleiagrimonas citrea TaxID=1665687 RepID=A0A846ZPF7_9GAMM|nr:dienelactone hydrolase family protein [Oleiagrimonas citrea]NKZ39537.1 dienelactone hydrolase family protein [Oleiagrimonas citrea]